MRGIDAFSGKGKRWLTSILLLVAMAALPLLFLYRNTLSITTPELQLGTAGLLRSRHQFSSYEEYLELQMKKTSNPRLRKLWTSRDWRRKVEVFSGIFARLVRSELLRPGSTALCIGARVGQEVVALKENGVQDSVGIDLIPAPPLVIKGDIHQHPFPDNTFDFEFSNVFDHALYPHRFISEIERTLKPGGVAVLHLILKHRGDKYSANDLLSLDPLLPLFRSSEILSVRDVDAFGLDTELIIRKRNNLLSGRCSPKVPAEIMERAEPLISEEPRKPWITLKRNVANIRYLPELLTGQGLRGNSRHVYVDVGARNYGSSIGSWFKKVYPTQGMNFSVFAIEADRAFHREYETRKKKVTLIPYAAWVRNETLRFFTKDGGMGRIVNVNSTGAGGVADGEEGEMREVEGFDFAEWLGRSVRVSDYVVMKMDVEGAEFELLPRLVESGGICLVDELFLECHYNRWQKCCPERTDKYRHTYEQCLDLFRTLRRSGVLVHQWW